MNCPDVTLRCMKSHLYHVVFISTCNVFKILFMFVFIIVLHTQSIFTVYTYPVRLLHVTLNINQPINHTVCCCYLRHGLAVW